MWESITSLQPFTVCVFYADALRRKSFKLFPPTMAYDLETVGVYLAPTEANTPLIVEMSSVIKVFRQLRPTLEAMRAGHQELRIGQIKRCAFILGA
jgi:hypothetical protein